MTKERSGKIFYEKMSGKGVEADLSGQGKNTQKRPLSNKTSEQREDHLAAERKRAAVKGLTKPPCRGKSASLLNANEQKPKCSTKSPRKEKNA